MTLQKERTRESDHPQLLEGLTKAIAEYHIVEGGSFQIVHQVARLRELIHRSSPKSIMEIGFNAGHSALLFLSLTPPETKVVSFDLGEYAYVFAAKRYIDSVFPGRHTLVTGDSTATIPKYEEQVAHRMKNPETAPPLRFDFIFIDGGHQHDIPMKDILNSQRLAAGSHTVVAIDDIARNPEHQAHYTIEPTKAWLQMISAGVVEEDSYDDYYELMKRDNTLLNESCRVRGMAWGRYIEHQETEPVTSSAAATAPAKSSASKGLRYNYYQNSSKYMDRNQMLQEIHNQHHYHKEHEKLVAIADMYLDYFPTYNKRDTNYVRFYRASSNFTLDPKAAIKQFEEIVDTPSPYPSNAPNGVNDSESELPDFIKDASIANLGMLYPQDPCPEIPKIIHLLYFGETEFYNFHHRCIHSMIQYMPDYEIRIYNAREPPAENKYWKDIRNHPRVCIHKLDPPLFFDGFELKHFQYKADVARLELLYEHGGIYLDIDMIIVRPFHEIFASGHSFYISEEREGANGRGSGALINAFLAAKPKNEFIKLWLNEFKSGLRLGIWAHHIRDSNKQLIENHPHYMHKYRIRVLDWKLFMPLHWQDTEAFIRSETVPYEFPAESYGTHLWETILGDIMRKNEFLQKQKIELDIYRPSLLLPPQSRTETDAAPTTQECNNVDGDSDDDLTIYPEYYHSVRNDQYYDKYISKGKHSGYFIDIGAGDGETGSSTYFFERYREWRGIAVEPAKYYEPMLRNNRVNPLCAAVSNVTSSITNGSGRGAIFYESVIPQLSGLKSALESNKDGQEWTRKGFKSYKVDTITLYDLCCQHSSPEYIDYCSVDCEGSEYEILSTFFEENKLTAISQSPNSLTECGNQKEPVNMIVLNKVFSIGFFSIQVSSNKMYERIRELMSRNHYIETINPYLSVLQQTNPHLCMKYFMLREGSGSGCGSGRGSGSSGSGSGNGSETSGSPQMSDRSISSISSGVNFTPQAIHTPPSSPEMTSSENMVSSIASSSVVSPASPSASASASAAFLHKPPFAEEVVVICLQERPERTKYVSDHLTSHGITHSILLNNINKEDTKVGCFRSHINAIRYAQHKNLSSVLILEDDILIRENIYELVTIPLPPNDWDILYFGGILTKYDGMDATRKWIKGTIWCNHAYLVKQHMYQPILDFVDTFPDLIELERRNIDYMYTEYIQPKYKCWLANEQYIIQKEGYSEIDGRVKWSSGFDWSTFSMKVV
jgi:FkbM family methyltransferase